MPGSVALQVDVAGVIGMEAAEGAGGSVGPLRSGVVSQETEEQMAVAVGIENVLTAVTGQGLLSPSSASKASRSITFDTA